MVCALALIAVPSAFAHASLLDTTPQAGTALERAPAQVVLRFDEPVSTVSGSVRVFDSNARRVDTGEVTKPASEQVTVGLPAQLPDDTYTVAWRVLSADSHPVRGAFVFSVGEPVGAGVASEVLDAEAASATVDWTLAVVRFLGLALILLTVGGVAVLAFVAEGVERQSRWLWGVLVAVGVLLAVDTVAWIALTGVKAAGLGLEAVFRWTLIEDVLDTGFGQAWLVRAALALALAGLALAARRRPSETLVLASLALASGIAVTTALSGHARVEGGVAVLSDSIHVLAAGVWVGGLALLAGLLLRAGGDRWSMARQLVPSFSTLAVGSVVALVTTGLVSGFIEVRSWDALWDTSYGRLLIVKVALLGALVTLGAYNNRVSVPRLGADNADAVSRSRFARLVGAELALMVVVVAVTAALVAEPPAKAQAALTVVSREGQLGPFTYTFTVDPARTGSNEIHVYLLNSSGGLARVSEISVQASLPAVDLGPLTLDARRAGPGHAVVPSARLPLAGLWRMRLAARQGEFDQWSTTLSIPIRKDP